MPKFSEQACDRISRVVRRFELECADNAAPPDPHYGDDPLVWMKLTEHLYPDSATPSRAPAWPQKWSASANGGKGGYSDDGLSCTVFDPTGMFVLPAATLVLCRPMGTDNGTIWEILAPPFPAFLGHLDGPLAAGSSATVSLYWGGGDSGLNVTAYDWLLQIAQILPAYTKVKVEFFPQHGRWYVTAAECSGG